MLVQLSPWVHTETSMLLPRSSRRRKRNGLKDDQFNAMETRTRFAASFLTTASKNSLRKMKLHSSELSDCHPILAVTSEHRIIAVGTKLGTHQPQHQEQNLDHTPPTSLYREYKSCFQYNSRPGGAGSFFAKPMNGVHHPSDLPTIAAIVDTKNDRVYALQHGNSRLCCWNSWEDAGPDEKTALRVELSSPVLSMTLLPLFKGIVYGTCLNGSIFVACFVTSKGENAGGSIVVKYIPTKQPKGTVHIGTLAELPVVAHQTKASGKKRKMSDSDGNLPVVFYQTFCDGIALKIVRHELLFQGFVSGNNPTDIFKGETLEQRIASLDLLGALEPSRPSYGLFVSKAELLISSSGTAPKVSLAFTVSTRSTMMMEGKGAVDCRLGNYCGTLSLTSGSLSHAPVKLPARAVQFGLVTESSVAAATSDEIFLFDLITGSLLQSKSMKRLARDAESDWVLITDTKHASIAVLYAKDEHLNIAFSNANFGESRKSLLIEPIKASSKLACSLLVASKHSDLRTIESSPFNPSIGYFGGKPTGVSVKKLENSVSRTLEMLKQSGRHIRHVNRHSDMHYLDVFQSCVATLVKETDGKEEAMAEKRQGKQEGRNSNPISPRNPQDSANDFKDVNGISLQSPKTVITKLALEKQQRNGCHRSPMTARHIVFDEKLPSCLPQSFLDGALQITLSVIRDEPKPGKDQDRIATPSLDARSVLKLLLHSGRISARAHFEGSHALQESKKEHPLTVALHSLETPSQSTTFSPVDFIHNLLQNCSDLSERQLVILLSYILRKATVHDIAESFIGAKDLPRGHFYKRLSHRYVNVRDRRARISKENDSASFTKSDAQELKTISKTLLLTGARAVLEKILYYSECNEPMLREALREGLSSGAEAALLARLLSNMLSTPPMKVPSQYKRHSNLVKALCQWVAALCESRREELEEARTSVGATYLSFLVNSVARVNRNAQATMTLKDDIGIANAKRRKVEVEARKLAIVDSKTAHFTEKLVKEEDIPGYSIERISF